MLALNATINVRRQTGERRIAAQDFFTGIYETALSPEDLLVAVELPASLKNSAHFFHEFARRHGDYAILGLAAQAIVEGDALVDLRLAFFAVGDRPVLAKAASKLVGVAVTPAVLAEACTALSEELDPHDDQQASAAMRRHLAKVLLVRCVAALLGRPDLNAGGSA
jgi:aerobic carbon-monoxide dehydrogenase medium subunit